MNGLQHIYIYIYTEGYSESTEPIDAVNILPLARFEPTTSTTPPSTTQDIDATNCATETSQKKRMFRKRWYWRRLVKYMSYIGSFSVHGIYFVRKWKPDGSKDTSEIR